MKPSTQQRHRCYCSHLTDVYGAPVADAACQTTGGPEKSLGTSCEKFLLRDVIFVAEERLMDVDLKYNAQSRHNAGSKVCTNGNPSV